MKVVHKTEKWQGHFTYLEGYGESEYYRKVEFSMEIALSDSSFTGISWDEESEPHFKNPASVKGFIVDNTISFILKYPCFYYKNEKGKIELDYKQEHPKIHYFGRLTPNRKVFICDWEMVIYQEESLEGYLEEVLSGSFEMHNLSEH